MEYNKLNDEITSWNMGANYYEILSNLKSSAYYHYIYNNAEKLYRIIKCEFIHISPYIPITLVNKDNVGYQEMILSDLAKVDKLIYVNFSGSKKEEYISFKHREALELLIKIEMDLSYIEAITKMLQPINPVERDQPDELWDDESSNEVVESYDEEDFKLDEESKVKKRRGRKKKKQ